MTTNVPSFSPKDFGKAAKDYATFRNGFPSSFFQRALRQGIGKPGQHILDLGTGTGTLARGFTRQGAKVSGLDITPELVEQAKEIGQREGVEVKYVISRAESTPFEAQSFDVITAGQCWHWFEGVAVANECMRLLKPRGILFIAHLNYLPEKGNVSERTEELILRYSPKWPLAGKDGKAENWREHLEPAGFHDIQSWYYDEDVAFTHEEWRGRMRACNGVLSLQDPEKIQAFDHELALRLKKEFPSEPMQVPHRVFAIWGQKA